MSSGSSDYRVRLPVSHAGASETFIPEGALLPGLVGPEREVEQEADRDHHGDHADHIPGPGSNDQRVRYVRRFAEENIVGSKGPVEQAYAQQQRLSNEGDLPPGAGAGPHADNKCQVTGGRENSSMSDVVIEEDEGLAAEGSIRVHHPRGQGEFRGGQGDKGSGDPPVEKAFVDFLVSPDEGHPGEDGRQVAQVKRQALIDIPEASAGEPELDQGFWSEQEDSEGQGQVLPPFFLQPGAEQDESREQGLPSGEAREGEAGCMTCLPSRTATIRPSVRPSHPTVRPSYPSVRPSYHDAASPQCRTNGKPWASIILCFTGFTFLRGTGPADRWWCGERKCM